MSTQWTPDLRFEVNFTHKLAQTIGSARALTIHLLLKGGPNGPTQEEWNQIASMECDSRNYRDVGNFADDYLISSLLTKSCNLPLGLDLESEAWGSFLAAETENYATNERLMATDYVSHPEWWHRFVKRVQVIMGPVNAEVLEETLELSKHGPGVVAGVKGEMVASKKYDASPTISEKLLPFAEAIVPAAWYDYAMSGKGFVTVNYGTFFTAPKNAKARRGCLYGPNVNQWFTLGLGRKLRRRLRKFGVDLGDQGKNQELARLAVVKQLATIDLKHASNSLVKALPLLACTDEWFHLLDLARDEKVKGPDGKIRPLQMFCAMGNGFTFALETIMFLACVQSVVPRDEWHLCTCYGDDIICPQAYATDVTTALEYLGFSVNTKKSFLAGSFFESCGTDWFAGQNVRPFFLRKEPESQIPYEVTAGNQLRLWAERRGEGCCDIRMKPLWEKTVASAPREWRDLRVPPSVGDCGFIASVSEGLRNVRLPMVRDERDHWVESGWEGFDVRAVAFKPVTRDRKTPGVLLSGLARLSLDPETDLEKISEFTYLLGSTGFALGGILPPELMSMVSSCGREPVRGLYRIARARWVWSREWPDGLWWGPPKGGYAA